MNHFFKTLLLFIGMIILGLALVFLAGHFDTQKETNLSNTNPVAK